MRDPPPSSWIFQPHRIPAPPVVVEGNHESKKEREIVFESSRFFFLRDTIDGRNPQQPPGMYKTW